ncbi:hypothetical protein C7E25_17210, partial [Stenotrophomonas maltophilia]
IASAGPLLGLLGTVIGMIQMFLGILDHGVGDVKTPAATWCTAWSVSSTRWVPSLRPGRCWGCWAR